MPTPHETLSDPDFRPQIRQAIDAAPLHTFSAGERQGNSDEQLSFQNHADMPDEAVVHLSHRETEPNWVYVTDPMEYVKLLEQTREIIFPWQPAHARKIEAQATAFHESRHAAKALEINSDAGIRYGVHIVRGDIDGEVKPLLLASLSIQGAFRKIDLARIAAAPAGLDELSPSDIAMIESLGYPTVEELDQRVRALEATKIQKLGDLAAS